MNAPWINIKDKLPENNKIVLLVNEYEGIFIGKLMNERWYLDRDYIDDYPHSHYSSSYNLEHILYWMPIPSTSNLTGFVIKKMPEIISCSFKGKSNY